MRSFTAAAVALVALVPSVMGLTINTPQDVTTCEPFAFTWSDGTPPYYLSLIPGAGQAPIKQFPPQNQVSLTWNVDLPPGTNFIASVKDASGTPAYAASATINAGTSTSCVNTTVNEGGSGAGSGTATGGSVPASSPNAASVTPNSPATSPATSPVTSPAASASSSHSANAAASSTASSSSASKSNNAASIVSSASTIGIAGLFGLVGAALF